MEYWELSDEELLKQCDWTAGRTGGPGGQARNKTYSAIKVTHRPTGLSGIASESRLQGENRALAMARLRLTLALTVRRLVDPATFTPPPEVTAQRGRDGKLRVNPDNPRYLPIVAAVLDLLEATQGQIPPAAAVLGITTTNFINFLHRNPKVWTTAQEMRKKYGLSPLKA